MGENGGTYCKRKMGIRGILKSERMGVPILTGIVISGLLAELFYSSLWGMWIAPVVCYFTHKLLKEAEMKRRTKKITIEFKDYLYAVSGTLLAGYSVERAFLYGLTEIEQLYGNASYLKKMLSSMEARLGMKEPMEHILKDFSKKAKSEEIENFVEIFRYAKRGGGDFLAIMETTISRICDRIELSEEIHAALAQKALEQKIMFIVPLLILLFFKLSSPDFIACLYGNALGVGIMTLALLLYGAAVYWGIKIISIEV